MRILLASGVDSINIIKYILRPFCNIFVQWYIIGSVMKVRKNEGKYKVTAKIYVKRKQRMFIILIPAELKGSEAAGATK